MVEHTHGMTGELAALLTYHYTAPFLFLDWLRNLGKIADALVSFILNPLGTILSLFLPDVSQLGTLLKMVIEQQGKVADSGTGRNLFHSAQVAGLSMVGIAVAGRALKMALSKDSVSPGMLLVDTAVRAVLTVAMIYSAYDVLLFLFQASCHLGGTLLAAFMNGADTSTLNKILSKFSGGFEFITQIVGLLMIIYVIFVVVGAKIMFWFAVSIAPLVIPIWAFGAGQQILQWWLKMMVGALLCPIVAGAGIGITLAFGQAFDSSGWPIFSQIAAIFIMAGGFFFTANMMRNLCSSAFEMGAVLLGTAVMMVKATQEAFQKVAGVVAAGATGGASMAATEGAGAAGAAGGGGGGGLPLMGGDGLPGAGLFLPDGNDSTSGESSDKGRFRSILSSPAGQAALAENGDDSLIALAGGDGSEDSGSRMRMVMAAATGGRGGAPNQAVVTRLNTIHADDMSSTPSSYAEEMAMEAAASAPKITDKRG
jgi:hypothetical protein